MGVTKKHCDLAPPKLENENKHHRNVLELHPLVAWLTPLGTIQKIE